MTRYARAKGSKASNKRTPEEATPWSELKCKATEKVDSCEQLGKQGGTNWKKIIKTEKKIEENVNSVWCDFDEDGGKKSSLKDVPHKKKNKIKRKSQDFNEGSSNSSKSKDKVDIDSLEDTVQHQQLDGVKVKKMKITDNDSLEENVQVKNHDNCINSISTNANNEDEDLPVPIVSNSSISTKPPRFKGSKNWSLTGKEFRNSRFQSQPHKRRKLDPGDQYFDINGETVVITRLDGFYIRKEDAVRIKELEKDLFKRGVSKQEVRAVVKKERRNAEKSFARQKKKVCFHCRKGGHNLSSCPSLVENGAVTTGSGICYKCGSTEHSHLECRVSTGYKFAKCFICQEEGHISRECPDNPRGLYPKGGGCKLCGDVTHFRRDCPQAEAKENVTLGVIQGDIEALPESETKPAPEAITQKRKNKIIKFK